MSAHQAGTIHSSKRLAVSVDREGPNVVLAVRAGTSSVTAVLHYRGASALSALLRDASGDDDATSSEVELRGELSSNG